MMWWDCGHVVDDEIYEKKKAAQVIYFINLDGNFLSVQCFVISTLVFGWKSPASKCFIVTVHQKKVFKENHFSHLDFAQYFVD